MKKAKKVKTKSRRTTRRRSASKNLEERIPYQKPALRSDAFARALTNAKSCADNPESLQALFDVAARKAATVPREPFEDNWSYLQTMLRLIRAYHRGEFDQVSEDALMWII